MRTLAFLLICQLASAVELQHTALHRFKAAEANQGVAVDAQSMPVAAPDLQPKVDSRLHRLPSGGATSAHARELGAFLTHPIGVNPALAAVKPSPVDSSMHVIPVGSEEQVMPATWISLPYSKMSASEKKAPSERQNPLACCPLANSIAGELLVCGLSHSGRLATGDHAWHPVTPPSRMPHERFPLGEVKK